MLTNECSHNATEKYVTNHGLVCRACLVEADYARYPGMRERLEEHDRRAESARRNFGHPSDDARLAAVIFGDADPRTLDMMLGRAHEQDLVDNGYSA
jgi:hypothetical protein